MNSTTKLWNVLSVFTVVILVAVEAVLLFTVWNINLLPTPFFVSVALVLFAFLMGICFLLFFKIRQSTRMKARVRVVIALILAVLMVLLCTFAFTAVGKLGKTLEDITEPVAKTSAYAVYVRTNDQAQSLPDASAYRFAMTSTENEDVKTQCVEKINEETGITINMLSYDSLPALVNGLYEQSCDAIILNSAYEGMLADSEEFADFLLQARKIYEIGVNGDGESANLPGAVEATPKPLPPVSIDNVTTKPFIIYLSGSDTRSEVLTASRSDVNILAVVNPVSKTILLLNTPRDYYVANPAGGGALDKLTHCGIYGVDCSMAALAELYGAEVKSYAQINFSGFETLIDAIGGIDVDSDVAFVAQEADYQIVQGQNHLNGYQALAFARERYNLPNGDRDRGKNQMKIISAVISRMSAGTLLSNYSEILNSITGMFSTNMTTEDISDLVKMQLSDMASWDIHSYAATGTDGSAITYSMQGMNAYVMYPDDASVSHAKALVQKVLNGETLTDQDVAAVTPPAVAADAAPDAAAGTAPDAAAELQADAA